MPDPSLNYPLSNSQLYNLAARPPSCQPVGSLDDAGVVVVERAASCGKVGVCGSADSKLDPNAAVFVPRSVPYTICGTFVQREDIAVPDNQHDGNVMNENSTTAVHKRGDKGEEPSVGCDIASVCELVDVGGPPWIDDMVT